MAVIVYYPGGLEPSQRTTQSHRPPPACVPCRLVPLLGHAMPCQPTWHHPQPCSVPDSGAVFAVDVSVRGRGCVGCTAQQHGDNIPALLCLSHVFCANGFEFPDMLVVGSLSVISLA